MKRSLRVLAIVVVSAIMLIALALGAQESGKAEQAVPTVRATPTLAGPTASLDSNWITYANVRQGYSIDLPSSWSTEVTFANTADKCPSNVIRERLTLADGAGSRVMIDAWHVSEPIDLLDWVSSAHSQMLESGGVEMPLSLNASISGHQALVAVQPETSDYSQIFYAYVHPYGRILRVTYVADDQGAALATYRRMLFSLGERAVKDLKPNDRQETTLPEMKIERSLMASCSKVYKNTCCGETSGNDRWPCAVSSGQDMGNCTWWAAKERPDVGNVVWGNACQWATQASDAGFSVDTSPRVGDVMVIESPCNPATGQVGHVAYVTSISGAEVTVTEMNWCYTCKRSKNYQTSGKKFIHPRDGSTCTAPTNGSPRDGVTLNNLRVTFTWTPPNCPALDFYRFRVGTQPNGGWFIDTTVGKDSTSTTQDIPSGYERQTLYWAVWSHTPDGTEVMGGPWSFRVDTSAPPPPPPTPVPGLWQVEYFRNKELSDRCATEGYNNAYIFKDWGEGAPAGGCNSDNWSARFTRRVHLYSGGYTFAVEADDWGRFYVNSDLVVNKWNGASQHYESRVLSEGDYDLRVEFADTLGGAKISAWWWGPGYEIPHQDRDSNQWHGEYWINPDQWWDAFARRNEGTGTLEHNWGYDGPGWGIPSDNFSTRFKRNAYFDCGNYRFTLFHDDGAKLWIDGNLVIDTWGSWGIHSADVYLARGNHEIQVDHREFGGAASVSLDWSLLAGCAPAAPALVSPGNGSYLSWDSDVTLDWNAVSGATEYYAHLQGGPGINTDWGWTAASQWHVGWLEPGSYSWTVKARNAYGDSPSSATWAFAINVAPPDTEAPPPFAPGSLWTNNFGASPAGGGWTSFNAYPRLSADVNGDGRADVVGFGAAGTYVSLSTGAAFGPASKWMSNFGAAPAGGGWTSFDQYPRQVADVNGDGKADIVGFGGMGTYVALSTGAAFGPASKWISNFGYAAAGGGWTSFNAYPRLLGDVNGDGRADVVGFGAAGAYVALSTGTSFGTPALWIHNFGASAAGGGWTSYNIYPRRVGDVNGDGRADIVGFGGAGTYVSLSTGSAFAPPTLWINNFGASPAGGGWTSQGIYPRLTADVNGDGMADIVGFGGTRVYVALSTGASFGSPVGTIANYCAAAGGWTTFDQYPRWVADVSGDARADIVGFGGAGTYVSLGQ